MMHYNFAAYSALFLFAFFSYDERFKPFSSASTSASASSSFSYY